MIDPEEIDPEERSADAGEFPFEEHEPGTARGITIAAVGASAGGLEAFSEVLRALPADTGMAFVLVQHLDPHHESVLAELLSSRTAMPVLQVHERTKVEANHVYVIPPNKTMEIEGETLTLDSRQPSGTHLPIDAFFISLAKERGANAIGVILSGTASDGTLGLKAIKAAGGVTFSQDLSAKFDSMPQNAVVAGVVDFVLPPNRIAAELASIASHPYYVRREQFAIAQDGPALQRILHLLRLRKGVDFAQYKQSTVQRRLVRRMAIRQADNLEPYLSLLQGDPAEVEALFQDLLINVTEFFRDPNVFASLKSLVFPRILKDRRDGHPIRAWIPGCSTGEEIYSIAICLAEYMAENGLDFPLQLFGSDVSDRVIDKARAGLYSETAIAAISQERLRRFFTKTSGGYQIIRPIREMCIFSRHNVAKDPPLSRMDLISCRNLLIYLTQKLQKRVVSAFGYGLRLHGCLVLGSSETVGSLSDMFVPLDGERRIFGRKPNLGHSEFDLHFVTPGHQGRHAQEAPPPAPPPNEARRTALRPQAPGVESYINRLLLTQYGPPGLLVDANDRIVEMRGDVHRFLDPTSPSPPQDLVMAIREDLRASVCDALEQSKRERRMHRVGSLPERGGELSGAIEITVLPIQLPELPDAYLILFHDIVPRDSVSHATPRAGAGEGDAARLRRELSSTRQYLQAIIEELRSTNEEAQSANEELQSTNEELQTAKEELQSSNEELNTMNAEMLSRNAELATVNDDLTNLLSSMNMPIVMMGRDLRIRRFTPLAESVLRMIPADVGRPISDLQPRINVTNLEQLLRDVLDSLVPHEQEVQDQEGHWYLMRIRPYRTADHRIEGAVLQLLDVGEIKRTLLEARQARDYAEAIVDTIGEPLLVLERSLAIRTANRSFYRHFRVDRHETLGRNLNEIAGGQLRHPKLNLALEALVSQNNTVSDLELEQESEDGIRRILTVNARMIEGRNEEKLILLAFHDVTDRKQAAEARYRRIFETARDGIVIVNADTGEISDVNPYVTQMSGYPRADLIGRKFWDTALLENLPQGAAALARAREQHVIRYPDVSIGAADGRTLSVEMIGIIYTEAFRRVIQFNLRDLTDRRKFERELQQAARLESIGLLAGGIAHDFNNLLTGVLGNASLMYASTPAGHAHRTLLRDIQQSAERAALLTGQMLAYAGKGQTLKERITLTEFIPEILPMIRTSIPKIINLVLKLEETTPDIDADPAQWQQLCLNLIVNAAEAIGEARAGKIEICTSLKRLTPEIMASDYPADDVVPGDYALLEINDTGSGMDEATRAKIFDPFFTTKFTGRGLGLAAAQGIVRQHGGAIHVFSSPGQGSAFQILAPAARLAKRIQAAGRGARLNPKLGTILLIEDEAMVRNVARKSLQDFGFGVVVAENGRQGVELFWKEPERFRLVLLDLRMPEMGGEDAFDGIRAIRPDIRIVLVSGFDEAEALRRMKGKVVHGFVQKPFTVDWLIENVLEALEGVE